MTESRVAIESPRSEQNTLSPPHKTDSDTAVCGVVRAQAGVVRGGRVIEGRVGVKEG